MNHCDTLCEIYMFLVAHFFLAFILLKIRFGEENHSFSKSILHFFLFMGQGTHVPWHAYVDPKDNQ